MCHISPNSQCTTVPNSKFTVFHYATFYQCAKFRIYTVPVCQIPNLHCTSVPNSKFTLYQCAKFPTEHGKFGEIYQIYSVPNFPILALVCVNSKKKTIFLRDTMPPCKAPFLENLQIMFFNTIASLEDKKIVIFQKSYCFLFNTRNVPSNFFCLLSIFVDFCRTQKRPTI